MLNKGENLKKDKKEKIFYGKYFEVSEKLPNFAFGNPERPTRGGNSARDLPESGWIPEWPNGADCKSAGLRLRWFESISTHLIIETCR